MNEYAYVLFTGSINCAEAVIWHSKQTHFQYNLYPYISFVLVKISFVNGYITV